MSITRSELKTIVKECLREILLEGLNVDSDSGPTLDMREARLVEEATRSKPATRLAPPKKVTPPQRKPAGLSTPGLSSLEKTVITETFSNINAGGINMAEIFADTAATSYRNMPPPGATMSPDPMAAAIADKDPLDLFGDAAKNWEEIAFR